MARKLLKYPLTMISNLSSWSKQWLPNVELPIIFSIHLANSSPTPFTPTKEPPLRKIPAFAARNNFNSDPITSKCSYAHSGG